MVSLSTQIPGPRKLRGRRHVKPGKQGPSARQPRLAPVRRSHRRYRVVGLASGRATGAAGQRRGAAAPTREDRSQAGGRAPDSRRTSGAPALGLGRQEAEPGAGNPGPSAREPAAAALTVAAQERLTLRSTRASRNPGLSLAEVPPGIARRAKLHSPQPGQGACAVSRASALGACSVSPPAPPFRSRRETLAAAAPAPSAPAPRGVDSRAPPDPYAAEAGRRIQPKKAVDAGPGRRRQVRLKTEEGGGRPRRKGPRGAVNPAAVVPKCFRRKWARKNGRKIPCWRGAGAAGV